MHFTPGDYSNAPTDMEQTQAKRKKHLIDLTDWHHRGHYDDYAAEYERFDHTYGLTDEDNPIAPTPIPKYASIADDETYGMITLFDDLAEALEHQADIPEMGETLNHPAGVIDMDTCKPVPYRMVALSEDAYRVVCGLVQPTDVVNSNGVIAPPDTWTEIRKAFPLSAFMETCNENNYIEDFGL